MYTHPEIDRDKITPSQALEILKAGNLRFISNLRQNKDYQSLIENTKKLTASFCLDTKL